MASSAVCAFRLAALPAFLLVLVSAGPGHATCDPTTDPDKSDIANARAAVAANCDCAGATSHGAYVNCAAQQANTVLTNKSCGGFVKRCAAHSICGKPNAVTCCITTTAGTKCKVKKDARALHRQAGNRRDQHELLRCVRDYDDQHDAPRWTLQR